MICTDPSCGCGIVSDSLTVTGTGTGGDPFRLETNAFAVVTSVTRPATPFVGQFIWETDTQRQLVWTGANWLIVAGAMPSWNLTRKNSDIAQSIANGVATNLVLLNEVDDSDGFHTGTTGLVTIPPGLGGDYLVTAGIQFGAVNDIGYRLLMINPASNTSQANEVDSARQVILGFNSSNSFLSATKQLRLEAGATVTLQAHQTSGVALDVLRAYFTGAMVRHLPLLT